MTNQTSVEGNGKAGAEPESGSKDRQAWINHYAACPLDESQVRDLLSMVTIAPRSESWGQPRRRGNEMALLVQPELGRQIEARAGSTEFGRFDIQATPALIEAVLDGMIYKNESEGQLDRCYYLEMFERTDGVVRVFAKYQRILGSRPVGSVDREWVIEKLAAVLAQSQADRSLATRPSTRPQGPVANVAADVPTATAPAHPALVVSAAGHSDAELAAEIALLHIEGEGDKARIALPKTQLLRYADIKALIEKAGGSYKRNTFVFPAGLSASKVLADLQEGVVRNVQQDTQFFATPPEVARDMVATSGALGPVQGQRVLEPSAGDGAIADVLREAGAAEIVTIESWSVNAARLRAKGYAPIERDFLSVKPQEMGLFDRVAMNPPFTRRQDIAHVRHALGFLKPDGRLAAVMSPAWQASGVRDSVNFRDLVELAQAGVQPLDAGTFKAAGTGVATVVVSFDMATLRERLRQRGESPEKYGITLSADPQASIDESIERVQDDAEGGAAARPRQRA